MLSTFPVATPIPFSLSQSPSKPIHAPLSELRRARESKAFAGTAMPAGSSRIRLKEVVCVHARARARALACVCVRSCCTYVQLADLHCGLDIGTLLEQDANHVEISALGGMVEWEKAVLSTQAQATETEHSALSHKPSCTYQRR